jgi:hypothetical protein
MELWFAIPGFEKCNIYDISTQMPRGAPNACCLQVVTCTCTMWQTLPMYETQYSEVALEDDNFASPNSL